MTKKTILTLYSLLLFVSIFVFEIVAKRLDHEWGSAPIERLSGMYIAVLFLLGYVFYSWKSNLPEFLKRFCISIPFAMLFSVFIMALGYDIYCGTLVGMFCFIMLLLRTENWHKHFIVSLLASFMYSVFQTISFRFSADLHAVSFIKQGPIFFGCLLSLSFLLLYLAKIDKEKRCPDLKKIIFRCLKFSIVLSLFVSIYLVLNFCDRFSLPFTAQLLVNTLLSIIFVVASYKYDLLLFERKNFSENNLTKSLLKSMNYTKGTTKSNGMCECCGKALPQELLFKSDSGKWLCAVCLTKNERSRRQW